MKALQGEDIEHDVIHAFVPDGKMVQNEYVSSMTCQMLVDIVQDGAPCDTSGYGAPQSRNAKRGKPEHGP
jgi:hypothetical protein